MVDQMNELFECRITLLAGCRQNMIKLKKMSDWSDSTAMKHRRCAARSNNWKQRMSANWISCWHNELQLLSVGHSRTGWLSLERKFVYRFNFCKKKSTVVTSFICCVFLQIILNFCLLSNLVVYPYKKWFNWLFVRDVCGWRCTVSASADIRPICQ